MTDMSNKAEIEAADTVYTKTMDMDHSGYQDWHRRLQDHFPTQYHLETGQVTHGSAVQ